MPSVVDKERKNRPHSLGALSEPTRACFFFVADDDIGNKNNCHTYVLPRGLSRTLYSQPVVEIVGGGGTGCAIMTLI